MRKVLDLRGKTFGTLTVLKTVTNDGRRKWLCRCECGNTKAATASNLNAGNIRSCGWSCPIRAARRAKHGDNLQMSSVHVTVPPRDPWEFEGDEAALIAMTEKETSNA
jgi:hypothetical protein